MRKSREPTRRHSRRLRCAIYTRKSSDEGLEQALRKPIQVCFGSLRGRMTFQERLIQDPDQTVPAIASQERLTIGYLSRLLRLPSLAPDIVTAIINGKHPPELSAKRLMRLALKLPTDWPEQRKLLGFEGA
jgi:hypothetical protein